MATAADVTVVRASEGAEFGNPVHALCTCTVPDTRLLARRQVVFIQVAPCGCVSTPCPIPSTRQMQPHLR